MTHFQAPLLPGAALALSLILCLGAALGPSAEALAKDRGEMSAESTAPGRIAGRESRGYRSFGREAAREVRPDRQSARATAVSGFVRGDWRSDASRDARRSLAGRDEDDRRDRPARRGWRDLKRAENIYARHGSYVYALDRAEFDDVGDRGGSYPLFVDIDPAVYDAFRQAWAPPSYPSETKFIDVESERLDRRPVGPDRIEVTYTGGSKIIRIAPDYRMATARRDEAASDTRSVPQADLQPWSAGWLRYCTQAHHSFDPRLGTYVARDGRIRFCER